MTPKRWWFVVLALATVVIVGVGVSLVGRAPSQAPTDCPVVRDLIDYNKSQGRLFDATTNIDERKQPSIDDYREWADRIHTFSTQIDRSDLTDKARVLAEDSQQLVDLVQQIRGDHSVPDHADGTPPGVQKYAHLAKEFHDNLEALDAACPKT